MTEYEEQKAFVQWLRLKGIVHFAVPNAARRSWKLAQGNKAVGMVPGAPDLVIVDRTPDARMPIAIEMKTRKSRGATDAQNALHYKMRQRGWYVLVTFGADDAITQMQELGF